MGSGKRGNDKPAPDGAPNKGSRAPKLDVPIQDAIGRKLRESYQQIVDEGVPPAFLDLLERLKDEDKP